MTDYERYEMTCSNAECLVESALRRMETSDAHRQRFLKMRETLAGMLGSPDTLIALDRALREGAAQSALFCAAQGSEETGSDACRGGSET